MSAFNGRETDQWNRLAYLLAELIEKHAHEIIIDEQPVSNEKSEKGKIKNESENNKSCIDMPSAV